MTLTSTFSQQDTTIEAAAEVGAAKARATRLLCAVMLAAAVFAGTTSQASAAVLNDGYGTYGSANYRCDHRLDRYSASVNMVTQGGAYQTMAYRLHVRNVATGAAQTGDWVVTTTRGGWLSQWSGSLTGTYEFWVQFAWLQTSGWYITNWERVGVQQAGLFNNVIEGTFNTCTL